MPKLRLGMALNYEQARLKTIVDHLIKDDKNKPLLPEKEILWVIEKSKDMFLSQPILIHLAPPITLCGDIHGQFGTLLKIFETNGYPSEKNYLFLGDYVDRGTNSIDCIVLLLCYKIMYPLNFFLIRGNHEAAQINAVYGFLEECTVKYNKGLWNNFQDAFNVMPLAATVGSKVFCVHGGIGPKFQSISQIETLTRPLTEIEPDFVVDMLWNDPEPKTPGFIESIRGRSFCYGRDEALKFLKNNNFDVMVRAHQCVQNGFEFPYSPHRDVITLFSATRYGGVTDNYGAIMFIDESLKIHFSIFMDDTEAPSRLSTQCNTF